MQTNQNSPTWLAGMYNHHFQTWARLSTARYLPMRDESLSPCKGLNRVMSHPSCQTLKDWIWPPEKWLWAWGHFSHGPCPRGPLSQDEGKGRGRMRCSMAKGCCHVMGVVRRSIREISEESRKSSWRKSSVFNSNQAQNAQWGEAILTFHTKASCLQPASWNPVHRC